MVQLRGPESAQTAKTRQVNAIVTTVFLSCTVPLALQDRPLLCGHCLNQGSSMDETPTSQGTTPIDYVTKGSSQMDARIPTFDQLVTTLPRHSDLQRVSCTGGLSFGRFHKKMCASLEPANDHSSLLIPPSILLLRKSQGTKISSY